MLVLLLALACKPIDNDSGTSADDTDVTDTDANDTDVTDTGADDTDTTDTDSDSDTNGDTDTGDTQVRFSGTSRLKDADYARIASDYAGDYTGRRIVPGDFDHDGQTDLAIGAPYGNGATTGTGIVYVVPGPITGDVDLLDVVSWQGSQKYELAGTALAAGDVDGDGVDDLVVGAPSDGANVSCRVDGNGQGLGTAYLLTSASAGGSLGSTVRFTRDAHDHCLGSDVAIGDVTGDGKPDVVVGSEGNDAFAQNGGAAFVFDEPTKGGDSTSAYAALYGVPNGSGSDSGYFGSSVKLADLDGDGVDDVVVGAFYRQSSDNKATGAVYVFDGPPSTMTASSADAAIYGHYSNSAIGAPSNSVAPVGDVDGDGLPDLLVGAWQQKDLSTGGDAAGAAYLVGAAQLTASFDLFFAEWKVEGSADEALGASVAAAGDLDGDGFADILVGEPRNHEFTSANGAEYLWYGSLSGTGDRATADATWYGTDLGEYVGTDAVVADLTGDGAVDVAIGASACCADLYGSVFVVPGGGF